MTTSIRFADISDVKSDVYAVFQIVRNPPKTFFDFPQMSIRLSETYEIPIIPTIVSNHKNISVLNVLDLFNDLKPMYGHTLYGKTNRIGDATFSLEHLEFIPKELDEPVEPIYSFDAFEQEIKYAYRHIPFDGDYLTLMTTDTFLGFPEHDNFKSFTKMGDYQIFIPKTGEYIGRQPVVLGLTEDYDEFHGNFYGTVSNSPKSLDHQKHQRFAIVEYVRGLILVLTVQGNVVGCYYSQMFLEVMSMYAIAYRMGFNMWVKPLAFFNENGITEFQADKFRSRINLNTTIRFQNYEVYFGLYEPREHNYVTIHQWLFTDIISRSQQNSTPRIQQTPSTSRLQQAPSTSRLQQTPSTPRIQQTPSTSRSQQAPSTSRIQQASSYKKKWGQR